MSLVIYTDGSCMPNPGPGGWAFVVLPDHNDEYPTEWHVSGGYNKSTNNRMEMIAVIEALKFINKKKCIIYTDSQYVINCANGKWTRKKNLDLWKEFDKASKKTEIEWIWVKGHSGDIYNEIVDKLAKKEVRRRN